MDCPNCHTPTSCGYCERCGLTDADEFVRVRKPAPLWPIVAVMLTWLVFGLACVWWGID